MSICGLTGGGGGGHPYGPAGGDLSGTYPDPSVQNDSHAHTVATLPATMPPSAHTHDGADINAGTISTARLGSGTANGSSFLRGDQTWAAAGVSDHGALSGLADDDHTQYVALAGRASGQTLYGGSAGGQNLILAPNSVDNANAVRIARGADGTLLAEFYNALFVFHRNLASGTAASTYLGFEFLPTSTVPTLCPAENDKNTGIGRANADQLSGIAGAVEVWRASAAAGALSAGMQALRPVEANTAGSGSPNLLSSSESRTLFTNEGATAENYHTLPTAAANLEFTFYCQDTDGIRVVANSGDTIRIAGSASAAAGFVRSSTVGSSLTLVAVNATEWVATSFVGVWTVDV